MRVALGAAAGAGVGAVVGAAVTLKFFNETDTDRKEPQPQKDAAPLPPPPVDGETPRSLIPAPTTRVVTELLDALRSAPEKQKTAVVDSIERIACLLAEVSNPHWEPDVLVQKDALFFKQDVTFSVDELMDICVGKNSTALYIEEVNGLKKKLMGHVSAMTQQVLEKSRDRLVRMRSGGGGPAETH